jgi:hypothetical protein
LKIKEIEDSDESMDRFQNKNSENEWWKEKINKILELFYFSICT